MLNEAEWFRMARFYYRRMAFQKPLSFSRLLTECQTLFDHFVFVQLLQEKSKVSKSARLDFSRKLKWDPSDFSSEK